MSHRHFREPVRNGDSDGRYNRDFLKACLSLSTENNGKMNLRFHRGKHGSQCVS